MKSTSGKLPQFLNHHKHILIILVTGLAVRLYNLTSISLWHDEAFSALLIKYSWAEMIHRIGLDVHPPLYYIFLRVWHYLFGSSLFSLRGMSVFFGVLTIIAVYFLVKNVFNNQPAAIIAAWLVALNPFQVQYVTEARMYTMGAFFAVLGTYALVIALRKQRHAYENSPRLSWRQRKPFLWAYFIFVLSCGIMMQTHYYLLFSVAALGLYGIWYHMKTYGFTLKRYGWLALSGVLILSSFLPWLNWFLFQYKQVGAGYWIPPMNAWSIPRTLYEMLIKIAEPSKLLMACVALLTIYAVVKLIRKYAEAEKWLILALFFAPFGGAILFYILAQLKSQDSSVYLIRYFIFSSSFYLIIFALFFNSFVFKRVRTIIVVLILSINVFAIGFYWNQLDVKLRPGMSAAAAFLNANVEREDKIFVGSSFEFFNYKYYNHTGVKPLLFSGGQTDIHNMPHYAGTAILTNEDLVPDFKAATASGDTVWIIWTNGFGGTKPSVPSTWTQIDEKGYADVRPYVGTWVIVTQYKVN